MYGVIDSIRYSPQGYPWVYVKGEKLDMFGYGNKHTTLQVGDSLVKYSRDRNVYVYRFRNDSIFKFVFD